MIIDIDRLRSDLIDYFGTAIGSNPYAMMEVIELEKASDTKIVQIALKNGFNLCDYQISRLR